MTNPLSRMHAPGANSANHGNESEARRILLATTSVSTALLLSLIAVGIALASRFAPAPRPREQLAEDLDVLLSPSHLFPEVRDMAAYVVGLLVLVLACRPVISFVYSKASALPPSALNRLAKLSSWGGVIAFAVATGWLVQTRTPDYIRASVVIEHPLLTLALVFLVAVIFYVRKGATSEVRLGSAALYLAWAVVGALFIARTSNGIFSPEHADPFSWHLYHHLSTMLSSMVMVSLGGTLLVDLENTYGLYPHFLEPITRLLGGDATSVTVVLAILVLLCWAAFFAVLSKHVRNQWVVLIAAVVMLYVTNIYHWLGYGPADEVYFQYRLLRVLFPAIFLVLLSAHDPVHRSRWRYGIHALVAASVLWNIDSGLAVGLAWCLVLLYQDCFADGWQPQKLARHLAELALALVFAAVLYTAFCFFRTGLLPDWQRWLLVARIYSIGGFMMIPARPVHPWLLIVAIYVATLAFAFARALSKPHSSDIFAVGLAGYGIGALFYFVGRSHDFVLLAVSLPAVLCTAWLIDELLAQRASATLGRFCLFLFTVVGLACGASAAKRVDSIVAPTFTKYSQEAQNDALIRDAAFIDATRDQADELVILSSFAWYFHIETGTRPARYLPTVGELVTRTQLSAITRLLESGEHDRIYIDQQFLRPKKAWRQAEAQAMRELLQRNYRLVAESPSGLLICLQRATEAKTSS